MPILFAAAILSPAAKDIHARDLLLKRMAFTRTFAFGGVGFVLAQSSGEQMYRVILSRPSAQADFEYLYAIGNVQAKCYALTGLRKLNSKSFEPLAQTLESSKRVVPVTRGCVTFNHPVAKLVADIRNGVYSGPPTRDPVPPNTTQPLSLKDFWKPKVQVKEESWFDVLRGLF